MVVVGTYPCTICCKIFNQKSNLNTHLRIHGGDKNFICTFPECSRKFFTKGNLTNHLKVHLNLRNFKCDLCAKSYVVEYQLKIHKLTHVNKIKIMFR